jgi:hypothetical protein
MRVFEQRFGSDLVFTLHVDPFFKPGARKVLHKPWNLGMARESHKTQVQRKERLGKRKVTEKKKERDGEKRGKKEQEKKRERKRSIPPPFLSIFSLLTKRRARYCTYLPTISFYRPKP